MNNYGVIVVKFSKHTYFQAIEQIHYIFTNVDLVLSFSFYITWVCIMRISQILIPIYYGYLAEFYVLEIIWLYTSCNNSHTWPKIALVPIWFRMILTEIISQLCKDSLTLTYPSNFKIWLALQLWYPPIGYLVPLILITCFMVLYTCIPYQNYIGYPI